MLITSCQKIEYGVFYIKEVISFMFSSETFFLYVYPILYPILAFLYIRDAWKHVKKGEDPNDAISSFNWGILFVICTIAVFTWNNASTNITQFYVSTVSTFLIYLIVYRYYVMFYRSIYNMTGNKHLWLRAKFCVILLSALLILWLIVLFGKFIHDNDIFYIGNLYNEILNLNDHPWYNVLENIKSFICVLELDLAFFKIGLEQLFDDIPSNKWLLLYQSYRWYLGSVVIVIVMNIILNAVGIDNIKWNTSE